jgi:large subunit ribosomal protein L11
MEFCKQFNARTQDKPKICPVQITVYKDKSFDLLLNSSSSCSVIDAAKLKSGSVSLIVKVASVTSN